MTQASTRRALSWSLRCFTTICALKEPETSDQGSDVRKQRSVCVFKANNKFLLISFDYLESGSSFSFKSNIGLKNCQLGF